MSNSVTTNFTSGLTFTSSTSTQQAPLELSNSTSTDDESKVDINKMTLTDFSIESIIGRAQKQRLTPDFEIKKEVHSLPHNTDKKLELSKDSHQQASNTKKYRPKNFPCPACPMAFSNNGQLKNHVRIHTGERPFRCNHFGCDKSFTRNEELTRHKLIHTGVRPHNCTLCGKRFGRKDHLKKHTRTHERKKQRKRLYVSHKRSSNSEVVNTPAKVIEKRESVTNISSRNEIYFTSRPGNREPKQGAECTGQQASSSNPSNVKNFDSNLTAQMSSLMTHSQFNTLIPTSVTAPIMPPTTQPIASLIQGPSNVSIVGGAQATIQQLASDWQKWYSLLGFYQQAPLPPQFNTHQLGALGNLFRRS